jgi:hypothetical protein
MGLASASGITGLVMNAVLGECQALAALVLALDAADGGV